MAKQTVLWVVEQVDGENWFSEGFRTRRAARGQARFFRSYGYASRVVKYIREA